MAGPQPKPPSPDLTSTLSGLGIDPAMLQMATEGEDKPEWVYEGSRDVRKEIADVGGDPSKFIGDSGEDRKRPTKEYKQDLYRKPPGEMERLQWRLYQGGFYDVSLEWDDIRRGDYDEDTRQAWDRAVDRAAAFYDADEKKTLDEVIDEAAQRRSESAKSGKKSGKGPLSVELMHPDDIRTVAMKTSTATLGRGWNEQQLDHFVATFQNMQRAAQTSAYGAATSGGVSTAAPDVQSAAESAARASDPVAAEGADYAGAYSMVLEAINSLGAK